MLVGKSQRCRLLRKPNIGVGEWHVPECQRSARLWTKTIAERFLVCLLVVLGYIEYTVPNLAYIVLLLEEFMVTLMLGQYRSYWREDILRMLIMETNLLTPALVDAT